MREIRSSAVSSQLARISAESKNLRLTLEVAKRGDNYSACGEWRRRRIKETRYFSIVFVYSRSRGAANYNLPTKKRRNLSNKIESNSPMNSRRQSNYCTIFSKSFIQSSKFYSIQQFFFNLSGKIFASNGIFDKFSDYFSIFWTYLL